MCVVCTTVRESIFSRKLCRKLTASHLILIDVCNAHHQPWWNPKQGLKMKTFIKYKVDEILHSIATTTSLLFILLSKLNKSKLSSRKKKNVLGITSHKSHLCDVGFVLLTFFFLFPPCHTSNFIYPTNGIKRSNSSKIKAEMRSLSRNKSMHFGFHYAAPVC